MNHHSFEREQIATAPEIHQEKTPLPEKSEKKDTVKKIIKAAIAALTLFYGASGGPGGTEADNKNSEIAGLLKEISSQKIVAKANHEKLVEFALNSFDIIMGGQEASAAELSAPLERITMDSQQLEKKLQENQRAWKLWWENHPEFKASQAKEFEAWANYVRLQDGDEVRILWKTNTQASPSIKNFKINSKGGEKNNDKTTSLADFFKAMARELGSNYDPANILNVEIDRDDRKLPGSLGLDPENLACPLLTGYMENHLPKGNLEKPDDTPMLDLKNISPRSDRSITPTQPRLHTFQRPPGCWLWVDETNATIAGTSGNINISKSQNVEPSSPPLLPSRTAAIRPVEIKPQATLDGPPQITTIKIEKTKTIEKPPEKSFGERLAEKLAINGDDIDAVYDVPWDGLTKKMPSLAINEGLFLSAADQKNPQVVENFKNLIISKGEQKLKEIEADLVKNFYFPAESLNDQRAIYDFAQKNLKDASKENKVAFFLLINSHKRILDLRAEYTAKG